MCLTEFDERKYEEVIREEGFENGLERGREEGFKEGYMDAINRMFAAGFSKENVLACGYTEDEIQRARKSGKALQTV